MSFEITRPGNSVRAPISAELAGFFDAMDQRAEPAAAFLKALSHEGRLRILYLLLDGERSVGEIEDRLGSRQAAVSQQLARLRLDGLVRGRRMGKTIHYSISDARVSRMIRLIHDLFGGSL